MRRALQLIVEQQLSDKFVHRKQRDDEQEQTWIGGAADVEPTAEKYKRALVLRCLEYGNWGRRNNETVSRTQI